MDKFDDFVFDSWYGIPLLIILVVVVCVALLAPLLYYGCNVNADLMETDFQWRLIGGCFLQTVDGSYIHRDLYRGVEVIREESND